MGREEHGSTERRLIDILYGWTEMAEMATVIYMEYYYETLRRGIAVVIIHILCASCVRVEGRDELRGQSSLGHADDQRRLRYGTR